ncbi:MAG: HAD family phosphatase [Thermodesulfobacteria bacterium]|nr:HAD family phosphatase [Thermodesulfobacteriota bacterium]
MKYGKNISNILFDMDGVILNSMPYHVAAWKDAFQERGIAVDESVFYLYEGAIEPEVACQLFASSGAHLTTDDFFDIHSRQKKYFLDKYAKKVKPFDKVEELLTSLKERGIGTALVTSSHGDILEAVLPTYLRNMFDFVVTGDKVKRRKPHPEPYLIGIEGLGNGGPKKGVAVENAPAGIKSAKNAGLSCVAITTTLPKKYLQDADKIVDSHEELLEIFKS